MTDNNQPLTKGGHQMTTTTTTTTTTTAVNGGSFAFLASDLEMEVEIDHECGPCESLGTAHDGCPECSSLRRTPGGGLIHCAPICDDCWRREIMREACRAQHPVKCWEGYMHLKYVGGPHDGHVSSMYVNLWPDGGFRKQVECSCGECAAVTTELTWEGDVVHLIPAHEWQYGTPAEQLEEDLLGTPEEKDLWRSFSISSDETTGYRGELIQWGDGSNDWDAF